MTSNSHHLPVLLPGELTTDFRTRFALEQSHAAERRRHEIAEQTSVLNTPDSRIRIWEQLHALGLPQDTAHPLLGIIARDTGLTLNQVQDEQRQRSINAAGKKDVPAAPKVWDPYCMLPRK